MKDDRHYLKFLDIRYHEKQRGFHLIDMKLTLNDTVSVRRIRPDGSYEAICKYRKYSDGKVRIAFPYLFDDEVFDLFENIEEVTDDEWLFFCTIYPEAVPLIGINTMDLRRVEAFLQGKGDYEVRSI